MRAEIGEICGKMWETYRKNRLQRENMGQEVAKNGLTMGIVKKFARGLTRKKQEIFCFGEGELKGEGRR